jgi:hypothetical protein
MGKRVKERWLRMSGARYYNPNLGRWPSRDPIGERGGTIARGERSIEHALEVLVSQLPSEDILSLGHTMASLRMVDLHPFRFLHNDGVTDVDALGLVAFGETCDLCCLGCSPAIGISTEEIDKKRVKASAAYSYVSSCLIAVSPEPGNTDTEEPDCDCCHHVKITWKACLKCDGVPPMIPIEEDSFNHVCEPTFGGRGGMALTIRAYLHYYECFGGTWLGEYSKKSNILCYGWTGTAWSEEVCP